MSRIFFEVARRFQDKGGGVKPIELAEELRITVDEILPAVRKLCEAEMLLMVESAKRQEDLLVVPGRPLEQITLIDLERCCGEVGYRPGELPRTAPAEAFERALGEARAGYEGHLTVDIASLLKAPEAPADDAPHDTRSSTQPG